MPLAPNFLFVVVLLQLLFSDWYRHKLCSACWGQKGLQSSRLMSTPLDLQPSLWKINDHAEHLNGNQISGGIKAFIETCVCVVQSGYRWHERLQCRLGHLKDALSSQSQSAMLVRPFVFLCGQVSSPRQVMAIAYYEKSNLFDMFPLLYATCWSDLSDWPVWLASRGRMRQWRCFLVLFFTAQADSSQYVTGMMQRKQLCFWMSDEAT